MFVHQGRRFGPVSTGRVQELCTQGVIRPDTRVHSTLFRRWVNADTVPALRSLVQSQLPADPATVNLQLLGINSRPDRAPWYAFDSLGPRASAWGVGLYLLACLAAGALRFADSSGRLDARAMGMLTGAAVWVFLIGLLIGGGLAKIGWVVSRRRRWPAVGGFAVGAALVLFAGIIRPAVSHKSDVSEAKRLISDLRAFATTQPSLPELAPSNTGASKPLVSSAAPSSIAPTRT